MSKFGEIISTIPPVVWSGALGSLITLLGVGFQNWFNGKRQREQLEHDAHQRNLQREMELRREVFLDGAAAIAQMQAHLGNFLNPLLTEEQHQLPSTVYEAISKAYLIANIETVEAINNVYMTFSKWSLKLGELKHSHGLVRHNQDIQDTTNSNTLEMLSNLQKHEVQLDFEGLIKFVENFNRQNQSNRDKADEELRRLELELAKEVSQATLEFERVATEANLASRKELGLMIDESRYKELIDNAAISVRSEFSEFVNRIDKLSEHKL